MSTTPDTFKLFCQAVLEDFRTSRPDLVPSERPSEDFLRNLSVVAIRAIAADYRVKLDMAEAVYERAFTAPMVTSKAFSAESPTMFGIDMSGIVARELGMMFASCLQDLNYLEMSFLPGQSSPNQTPILVTVARTGKRPSDLRESAESELSRAMTLLSDAKIPFKTHHEFLSMSKGLETRKRAEQGADKENCRIDVTVEPNELFCTLCKARQPFPAYFSFETWTGLANSFRAEHDNGACRHL